MPTAIDHLNLFASVLHYASFVALCILLSSNYERGNIKTFFFVPTINGTDEINAGVFTTEGKSIFSVASAILIECFWTATAHALYFYSARRHGDDGFYLRQLNSGVSTYRWIEYAVSASIIWTIVSLYSGVRDTVALVYTFVCTAGIMYTGYLSEKSKLFTVPIVSGFGVLVAQVIFTGIQLGKNTGDMPDFVIPLFSVIVLLYSLFGVVRVASAFGHEKKPRTKSEIAYIVLSLTVKSIYRFVLASRVFK